VSKPASLPASQPLGQSLSQRSELEARFADAGGLLGVFSDKAQAYARARPGHPEALYVHLEQCLGIAGPLAVADVGAGTGLLTLGWLERGHRVVAVEPNAEMRAAAYALLAGNPLYRSSGGSAEATGLEAHSIDLITAAQAFHWFDLSAFRAECQRILRSRGLVALIWNDRGNDALNNELTALFAEFGGAKRAAMAASNVKNENITQFFGGEVLEWTTTHTQSLDAAGLAALAFLRSFMPRPEAPQGAAAARALQSLVDAHAVDGHVQVNYLTRVFAGRLA
jgi:SAM-dependent methyltransferase